jgi:hypothetical protein
LLVVFLTTLVLVSAMAISPSVLTNGKREKEEEMIWRGKQYVRGVKLYYRKMGRFPTSLDDLTKPQVGSLRFMRQAYKDPMNKQDGTWRLIYVGPAGQLVGSLKPQQNNLQLPGVQGMGTPAAALGSGFGTQQGVGGTSAAAGATQVSQQPGGAPGTTTTTGAASTTDQANGTANGQNDPMANPPADSGFSSSIIGGNIIGVGSKVNEHSLRVYEKAKNYRLFEFIWDPTKDAMAGGQPGMQTGTGLGTPIGQPLANPAGGQLNPTSPTAPTTNPQSNPTPNPQ